jgi:hypothetical protein
MSPLNIAEIVRQKLIVKVCPMHPETLELREWLVIANVKVTAADRKQSRGPKAISGDNRHLEMAEHYYGVRKSRYYDRDNWIVSQAK